MEFSKGGWMHMSTFTFMCSVQLWTCPMCCVRTLPVLASTQTTLRDTEALFMMMMAAVDIWACRYVKWSSLER